MNGVFLGPDIDRFFGMDGVERLIYFAKPFQETEKLSAVEAQIFSRCSIRRNIEDMFERKEEFPFGIGRIEGNGKSGIRVNQFSA